MALTAIITRTAKGLPGTKYLTYLASWSVMRIKKFYNIDTGSSSAKASRDRTKNWAADDCDPSWKVILNCET